MLKEQEKLILRPRDVQELTGLGRIQVYELWKRSDFPGKKHGRSLFVSRKAFEEWLEKRDGEREN
ncbi:MAG: helix-turn-helix domain-containing protein [Candidatus Atribacteria bacterium]|nr:helix-turn-helix domain-containing protein [Candidatus Atribacteria bacterium]